MSEPAGAAEIAEPIPSPGRGGAPDPADSGRGPDAPDASDPVPAPESVPAQVRSADPRVDDALSRLAEIDQLPLAEQVEVFGDIHRRLAAVLADPDSQAQ